MPKRRKLNNNERIDSRRSHPKRSHVCPICSSSIPISELRIHYLHERNLLSASTQPTNKRPAAVVALSKIIDRPRVSKRTEASNLLSRVRTNRESRRNNRSIEDDGTNIEECPVCGLRLIGIGIPASEHVSSCLDAQMQEERQGSEDNWDIYEVAGQRRVRAIGLLEGGVQSIPDAIINRDEEGLDVFVDVEGDTEAVYGRPQYSDADLVNPAAVASTGKPSGLHFITSTDVARSALQYLLECVLHTRHFCSMLSCLLREMLAASTASAKAVSAMSNHYSTHGFTSDIHLTCGGKSALLNLSCEIVACRCAL